MVIIRQGEMMRELNLFDSQARAAGNMPGELSFDNEPFSENIEMQTPQVNNQPYGQRAEAELPEANGRLYEQPIAAPDSRELQSKTEETQPQIPIRNEQVKDTGTKTIRKGKTIDQIIVLYDDLSFIAYSPGN